MKRFGAGEERIRLPAVAGTFYPSQKESLQRQIGIFLEGAEKIPSGKPRAIIVPHAGYIYSGQIAGLGYKNASGRENVSNAVIVGPSHFVEFEGSALSSADAWRTPLGEVQVNKKYFDKSKTEMVAFDDAHEQEHSVEVQVPFVQTIFPGARIVPIVTGFVEPEQVAQDLDSALSENDLLVISTDLSHYYPYERARQIDSIANRAIPALEIEAVEEKAEACGKTGVLAAMRIAKKREWKGRILGYANSGDTAGGKGGVVGYGCYAFY